MENEFELCSIPESQLKFVFCEKSELMMSTALECLILDDLFKE
jgi:hypothetical protein